MNLFVNCQWIGVLALVAMAANWSWGQEAGSNEVESTQRVHPDETSPIALGVTLSLDSKVLSEKRTLNVYLPPSYETSKDKKYPVIYLLDGGIHEDYHHQTGLVQFMVMYQLMPESIVVGISNTDRRRDLTHPTKDAAEREAVPTCGGSAKFLEFIETELQPLITKTYRCGEERTLIGQSLGALFATEALLRKPELFDNFVIVSPSLYWSKQELVSQIADFLKKHPDLKKKIFLSIGTEPKVMHETMDQFVAALKEHAPEGVKWKYDPLPKETHATVMHRATYRAYEFLYGDKYKGL